MSKDRFNEYRNRANISFYDMRDFCKLGVPKARKIAEGKSNRVTVDNILLLARAFNVSEDEMFNVFYERCREQEAIAARKDSTFLE